VIISYETIRKYVPSPPDVVMHYSGYFVHEEQYACINGMEKYRALQRFTIPKEIFITTDWYHYESVLERYRKD